MIARSSVGRARGLGRAAVLLLLAGLVGWLAGLFLPTGREPSAIAEEDGWPPRIGVNRVLEGEDEIGELLINDEVVLRLWAPTRELTPYERIVVVAERLKLHVVPRDRLTIRVGLRGGSHVVLINDAVLLTPLQADLPEGMSLREGAQMWAEWLGEALGLEPAPPEEPEPWQALEPYEDKIVPIVSLGSGKRIGGARVNGPETAVRQVQAVVQIEARLLSYFQVQLYVPISTQVPGRTLDRVQGVAVTAVGDLKL